MNSILYMMVVLILKLRLSSCRLIDDKKPTEVCWYTVKEVTGTMTLCPSSRWTGVGSFTEYHVTLAKGLKKAQREMLNLKRKLIQNHLTEGQDNDIERNSYQLSNLSQYHFSGPKEIGTPIDCLKNCTVTISYTDQYGFIISHSNFPIHTHPAPYTLRYHLDHPGKYQFISNQLQWFEEVYTKLLTEVRDTSTYREDSPVSLKVNLKLDPKLPDAIIHYHRL